MISEQHIAHAFDRDLESIQALIMKMGGLAEKAILDSAQALETRDEELANQVRAGDKVLDELEDRVHADCAQLIARRSPTAGDLRTVLTVMKVAAALERVGDYAKNIAKRSVVLAQGPAIDGSGGAVRRMAKAVEELLKDALDAYIQRDVELANDGRRRDKEDWPPEPRLL